MAGSVSLFKGTPEAQVPITIQTDGLILIQGNTLKASTAPVFNHRIYASFGSLTGFVEENDIMAIRGDKLIFCLISKESGGKENAKGKAGEIGILQFMPKTFEFFSRKYNLDLDIYNPNDQILLAKLMIDENPKNVWHWTTYKFCR